MKGRRVIVGLLLVASLVAKGKLANKSETVELKLAHELSKEHVAAQAYAYFANKLAEYSKGKIRVTIFPNGKLGNTKHIIEQVQAGTLDMGHAGGAYLENFVPEYAVFGLPYLFRGKEHLIDAMQGELGRRFTEDIPAKMGLYGLMYAYAGARSFYTNKMVKNLEGLQGLKIRVQPSEMAVSMVKALGASPTPMTFGEVYSALQQGVLDGAENNPPSYISARHYEISKFFLLDEHQMVPDFLLINRKVWQALDNDARIMLEKAAMEAQTWQVSLWDQVERKAIETAKASGSVFTQVDKGPFQRSSAKIYETAESNEALAPLIRLVRSAG